jgi:hypothetical protein
MKQLIRVLSYNNKDQSEHLKIGICQFLVQPDNDGRALCIQTLIQQKFCCRLLNWL